jgi:hypothetical protein
MPSEKPDEVRILADTKVSMPLIVPMIEDADLNGFAFSLDFGIVVGGNRPEDRKDALSKLRGWSW